MNDIDAYVTDNRLPLSLLGSSYRGVSVNDCIYRAKQVASNVTGAKL